MDTIGFDCETTGVDPGSRVVEVGAVRVHDQGYEVLVEQDCNPGIPIAHMHEATAINGFSQARADAAKPSAFALGMLHGIVSEAPGVMLCSHNARFDCGMLAWELQSIGYPVPDWPVICTLDLARMHYPRGEQNLLACAKAVSLQWDGAEHRAVGDAWKSASFLRAMGEKGMAVPAPRPFSEWAAQWDGAYTQDFPPGLDHLPDLCAIGGELDFTYATTKGKEAEIKRRTIIPQGYAMRGGVLHFHGWCLLANDRRAFRFDRVVEIHSSTAGPFVFVDNAWSRETLKGG